MGLRASDFEKPMATGWEPWACGHFTSDSPSDSRIEGRTTMFQRMVAVKPCRILGKDLIQRKSGRSAPSLARELSHIPWSLELKHMDMGSKPRTPSEHPNPTTKIDQMGGEFIYPNMGSHWF